MIKMNNVYIFISNSKKVLLNSRINALIKLITLKIITKISRLILLKFVQIEIITIHIYYLINEIIAKFDVIFKIYDKIVKFDIELYNLNFQMKIKNKKKNFEFFYIRFNTTIASLNYSNILKIFNLKRLINIRLKYRISNKNFVMFKNFVIRLRYIVVNLEIINNVFSNKNKN